MNDARLQSIMTTYPGFHGLPREIKRFLLASEECFFNTTKAPQPTRLAPEISSPLPPPPGLEEISELEELELSSPLDPIDLLPPSLTSDGPENQLGGG